MPKIGYGSNKKTRHMLPNGFHRFRVYNVNDLAPRQRPAVICGGEPGEPTCRFARLTDDVGDDCAGSVVDRHPVNASREGFLDELGQRAMPVHGHERVPRR